MRGEDRGREGGEVLLYGVGLGPGDPELLTLKARKVLEESSLIFVPTPRGNGTGRALSILSSLDPGLLRKAVPVEIPMAGDAGSKWDRAASTVLGALPHGGVCSFVNEGDPLLYGSFLHLLRQLRKRRPDLRVEVVSGIPSFIAAAAGRLAPLASGRERVVILPGPVEAGELEELLDGRTVVVLLKFNLCLEEFRRFLAREGERVEWWCVENCTLPEERLGGDLASLSGNDWNYFTLAVIRRRAVPPKRDAAEERGRTPRVGSQGPEGRRGGRIEHWE